MYIYIEREKERETERERVVCTRLQFCGEYVCGWWMGKIVSTIELYFEFYFEHAILLTLAYICTHTLTGTETDRRRHWRRTERHRGEGEVPKAHFNPQ